MNKTDNLDTWLRGLREDPTVFPHQLDAVNRRLLLVRIQPERIHETAFLDQRVLTGNEAGGWVPLASAIEARPATLGPAGIILHCGHCGSTLISRLLGELPGAWVLREPLVLQSLAAEARAAGTPRARLTADEFNATLELTQRAFGNTPMGATRAIVKHTSLTANLGPALLARDTPPAVLCLAIPLEDYLAAMLRDSGLREGVRLAAGEWIHDIAAAIGNGCPKLADLNDAELAALNWTAAQLAFPRARERNAERVLTWRFDDFLADPQTKLAELARHFGLDANERNIARALSSPWPRRYAKDPRQAFDAATRRRELAAAKRQFASEIRAGLRFAEALHRQLPLANNPDS
jgi:hypothetical protein